MTQDIAPVYTQALVSSRTERTRLASSSLAASVADDGLLGDVDHSGVVSLGQRVALKLEQTQESTPHSLDLHVRKALADAPVPACAEGDVVVAHALLTRVTAHEAHGVEVVRLVPHLLETVVDGGGDTDVVACRDHLVLVLHVGLHHAHHGHDGGPHAEGLLQAGIKEIHALKVLVVKFLELGAHLHLFSVQLVLKVLVESDEEAHPRAGGGASVLASKQEGDQHAGNVLILKRAAILVVLSHEGLEHILLSEVVVLAALLDDIDEDLLHALVGTVAGLEAGEGEPVGKEPGLRGETLIKIGVGLGNRDIEQGADFLAKKAAAGGHDNDFRESVEKILLTRITPTLEVLNGLLLDLAHVGLKASNGETGLCHSLLLTEDRVLNIVSNALAENGDSKVGINLLSIKDLVLGCEEKGHSLRADQVGALATEESDAEDIAVLEVRLFQELNGLDAELNNATKEGELVGDHRGETLVGGLGEDLNDVGNNE
eukprot:Colp12_sorted_trinity150504_noHs@23199